MAAFAIGLPKASGQESEGAPQVKLSLPDELPGGYRAADDTAAFKGGQLESQAEAIAKQQAADRKHGDAVLPAVLGHPAATRTYVAQETQAVFVQVFQSEGGAFAPNTLPDPASSGGQAATTMERVGDGACILTFGQDSSGQQSTTPSFSQCQVSRHGLTVQIGSAAVAPKELVSVGGDVIDGLSS